MEFEADDISLIDGPTLDDLLDSISENGFVGNGVTELEKRMNEKYDMRKSLAWDSAFLNCAGVLDAEELSSMIERSNRGRHQMWHSLDISKFTDSLSSFESNLALESLEADLFCDVRSSIQRSGGSSESRKSSSNRRPDRLSGTKSTALHGNMKSVSRKLNASIQGDGKLMKLGHVREQVRKPGGSRREPQASLSKLPAASDGKNLRAMASAKPPSESMPIATGRIRSSLNNVGNTTAAGSGTKVSNFAKSLSHSPTMRTGTSSTRSSYDSRGSLSKSSRILSRIGLQGKSDGTVSIPPSSLRNRMPSRVPLNGKIQPRISRISTYSSTPKLSPSASPTSSISARSSSSAVTINQEHHVSKDFSNLHRIASLESISYQDFQANPIEQTSEDHEHEVTGVPSISAHIFLADNRSKANPASAKPSGLRMPTPKIGFFEGVKTPKAVGMQSGLPTSRFDKATAIAVGNSNPNIQRSNARLAPTGRVHERSTASMKPSNGKNVEAVSTTLPKIKGLNNFADVKISDGGKRLSESGSSSRKKSGLTSRMKHASQEGKCHLKGNQVASFVEADHHPLEICNESGVLNTHLLHGLVIANLIDAEFGLANVSKEVDITSSVDDGNSVAVAKRGAKYDQVSVEITDQQHVGAEQLGNVSSGHVEAVGNKTRFCEVNFASDTQLLHELINGDTTELDLLSLSKEVDSTSYVDDENADTVLKRGGNEATDGKYGQVCVVITDQQYLSAEQQENGLSGHMEVVGNETQLCVDTNGNFEPHNAVNFASDTQLLHGLINGDTTDTELVPVIVPTEVDMTLKVDDENADIVVKRGGNEAMNQKYGKVCVLMTDQRIANAEQKDNKTDLCEDMNRNFEPQSCINFASDSHLPAVSSAAELLGFNQKEETAGLPDKYSDSGKSNPGSRTPFADKNSMSNAYSMETLMKRFTSLSLDSVQGENVET